jgi:hypothetical protein
MSIVPSRPRFKAVRQLVKILWYILIGGLLYKMFEAFSSNLSANTNIDVAVKNIFERIYAKRRWTNAGNGSGPGFFLSARKFKYNKFQFCYNIKSFNLKGSTIEYTQNCRNIIYSVIKKYDIKSLLDSPCGSFIWMNELMKNVSFEIVGFEYHGVDIVGPVITYLQTKFANSNRKWQFNLVDMSAKDANLPDGYDLIFSRDAMQVGKCLRGFPEKNVLRISFNY